MGCLGNIIWCLFGGCIMALIWAIAGILLCCTFIGIPFGIQCFKLAAFTLSPFGHDIVYGDSTVSLLGNILWIIFFGWGLAACALVVGAFFCATIIGIPFGLQYFKFARLSLMPFGATIV